MSERMSWLLVAAALAAGPVVAESELPDPTRPAVWRAAAPAREQAPAWRLESTLISPQRRLAVIDGRLLRPGDRLDDAQVLEIQPDRVTLRHGDRIVHLRLLPDQTKKRPRP